MKLTNKEVKRLSELARLELSDEEIKKYGEQISSILDYVKQLDEIDTTRVKIQNHLKEINNVFRADEIIQNKESKKIINQFPVKAGNLNKVKAVMEK